MAKQTKNQPPLQALPALPIRMLRLHAKLLVAAVDRRSPPVLLMPWDWRVPTRLSAGWDIGVVAYVVHDAHHGFSLQRRAHPQARCGAG